MNSSIYYYYYYYNKAKSLFIKLSQISAIAAAENIMILVMLKLIGKQRPVNLTVGFVDTVLKDPEKIDNALNSL